MIDISGCNCFFKPYQNQFNDKLLNFAKVGINRNGFKKDIGFLKKDIKC